MPGSRLTSIIIIVTYIFSGRDLPAEVLALERLTLWIVLWFRRWFSRINRKLAQRPVVLQTCQPVLVGSHYLASKMLPENLYPFVTMWCTFHLLPAGLLKIFRSHWTGVWSRDAVNAAFWMWRDAAWHTCRFWKTPKTWNRNCSWGCSGSPSTGSCPRILDIPASSSPAWSWSSFSMVLFINARPWSAHQFISGNLKALDITDAETMLEDSGDTAMPITYNAVIPGALPKSFRE